MNFLALNFQFELRVVLRDSMVLVRTRFGTKTTGRVSKEVLLGQ